jgi:purine nucleosidase
MGVPPTPVPLVLDVDTGIDDSLALLYAAVSPDAELLLVTTCAGNVGIDDTTHNTLGVLALVGRTDVEVARGRRRPIARALEITPETHGPHGIGYATVDAPQPESPHDGVTRIVELARARPGEIVLVTLGPLTNLAAAVLAEPALPELLRAVYVMGGCFAGSGNTSPREEWNIHVDPEAARVVTAAWEDAVGRGARRLQFFGLDVTERARLLPADLVALCVAAGHPVDHALDARDAHDAHALLAAPPDHPVLRLVFDALRFYFEFHERFDGFYGAFIHDPLVVAVALDPALATTKATTVDIELGGSLTAGETVADWRNHWGRTANADVAVTADADEFLRRLVARVGGWVRAHPGERPGSPSVTGR